MNLMKKAHQMTKKIKAEYPTVNYSFQLGLCLSYLSKVKGEVKMGMAELKGSEKQIKWAQEIRNKFLDDLKKISSVETNYFEKKIYFGKEVVKQSIFDTESEFVQAKENLNKAIELISKEESAKVIINSRNNLGAELCRINNIEPSFMIIRKKAFDEDVVKINLSI